MLQVGGELADVPAVGVAAVDIGHLGHPAVDPAAAPCGDEHDAAVGQPARLDVVVDPVGQLPQAAAVGVESRTGDRFSVPPLRYEKTIRRPS